MIKKFLSLLLVMIMVIGLLPAAALAGDVTSLAKLIEMVPGDLRDNPVVTTGKSGNGLTLPLFIWFDREKGNTGDIYLLVRALGGKQCNSSKIVTIEETDEKTGEITSEVSSTGSVLGNYSVTKDPNSYNIQVIKDEGYVNKSAEYYLIMFPKVTLSGNDKISVIVDNDTNGNNHGIVGKEMTGFFKNLHTVTYKPGTQGTWKVTDNGSYRSFLLEGDNTPTFYEIMGYRPDAKHNPGYTFKGWSPKWSHVVKGTVEYTAQWREKNDYTVIYDATGGSPTPPPRVRVSWTEEDLLPTIIPSKPGYTLDGWVRVYTDKEGTHEAFVESSDSYGVLANGVETPSATIYAKWVKADDVTINYVASKGGSVLLDMESVPPVTGNPQGSTATADPGYSFVNWTKVGEEVGTEPEFIPLRNVDGIYEAATYIANFKIDDKQTYTINYVAGEGGEVDPEAETYQLLYTGPNKGSTATALPGYKFVNWTSDAAGEDIVSTSVNFVPAKNEDATYYANFEIDDDQTYTINYKANTGGSVAPISETWQLLYIGEKIGSTATALLGYIFVNWTSDEAGEKEVSTDANFIPTVNTDATYWANFEIDEKQIYTINYVANDGGTVAPADETHQLLYTGPNGGSTATALPGYIFVNWTSEVEDTAQVSINATYVPDIHADATFYANFEIDPGQTYTIKYESAGNGVVDPESETHQLLYTGKNDGSTATAASGYRFLNWTDKDGAVVGTDELYIPVINTDATFYANFEVDDDQIYTIEYMSNGNGSVSPASEYHWINYVGANDGSKATAATGYKFKNWTSDAAGLVQVSDDETFVPTVHEDATFYASFEIDPTQKKTISYTVEYYIDGKYEVSEPVTEEVWVNAQDTLKVLPIKADRYAPIYGFSYTDPDKLPETIEDGGVIKAYYVKVIFTVTYKPGEHGGFEPQVNTEPLYYGSLTPPFNGDPMANADAGWQFTGWYDDISKVFFAPDKLPETVTGDATYIAQWTMIDYKVIFEFGGNGGDIEQNDIDKKYHVPGQFNSCGSECNCILTNKGKMRNFGRIVYDGVHYGEKLPEAPYPFAEFGYKFMGWRLYLQNANGGWSIPTGAGIQTLFAPANFKNPYVASGALYDKGIIRGNVKFVAEWELVIKSQEFPDKIPSTSHLDSWWTDYSIICYAASNGDVPYFVGFNTDFFSRYRKVGIGFGSGGTWDYVVTFYESGAIWEKHTDKTQVGKPLLGSTEQKLKTIKDVNVTANYATVNGAKRDTYSIHKNVTFDAKYTNNGKKKTNFGNLKGIWFDDPFGSGARQAWLGAPADMFDPIEEIADVKVTWLDEDGNEIETAKEVYAIGEMVYAPTPAPSKEGHNLVWVDDHTTAEGINVPVAVPFRATREITLRATFVPAQYNIKYNLNGGKNSENNRESYTYGDTITLHDPVRSRYSFIGWTRDAAGNDFVGKTLTECVGDLEFFAQWESDGSIIVTINVNGRVVDMIAAKAGDEIDEPVEPTLDGYVFIGWFVGAKQVAFPLAVYDDIELNAEFEVNTYYITYDLDGGNNDAGNPDEYTVEETITLKPATKDGFIFSGWLENGKSVTGITKGSTGDKEFTASWTEIPPEPPKPPVPSWTDNFSQKGKSPDSFTRSYRKFDNGELIMNITAIDSGMTIRVELIDRSNKVAQTLGTYSARGSDTIPITVQGDYAVKVTVTSSKNASFTMNLSYTPE